MHKKTPREVGKTSDKIKVFRPFTARFYMFIIIIILSLPTIHIIVPFIPKPTHFFFIFLTIRLFSVIFSTIFPSCKSTACLTLSAGADRFLHAHRSPPSIKEREWLALSFYLIIIITLFYPANHFHRILYLILILRF